MAEGRAGRPSPLLRSDYPVWLITPWLELLNANLCCPRRNFKNPLTALVGLYFISPQPNKTVIFAIWLTAHNAAGWMAYRNVRLVGITWRFHVPPSGLAAFLTPHECHDSSTARILTRTDSAPRQLTSVLGRCGSPARSRSLRLYRSAHAFSVQFPMFEEFEYLVCGQSKIIAHCEDYFPIGSLHGETHGDSVLPQQLNRPHNVVRSLCETTHNTLRNDMIAETEESV
jgi:hypothetical protein